MTTIIKIKILFKEIIEQTKIKNIDKNFNIISHQLLHINNIPLISFKLIIDEEIKILEKQISDTQFIVLANNKFKMLSFNNEEEEYLIIRFVK